MRFEKSNNQLSAHSKRDANNSNQWLNKRQSKWNWTNQQSISITIISVFIIRDVICIRKWSPKEQCKLWLLQLVELASSLILCYCNTFLLFSLFLWSISVSRQSFGRQQHIIYHVAHSTSARNTTALRKNRSWPIPLEILAPIPLEKWQTGAKLAIKAKYTITLEELLKDRTTTIAYPQQPIQ